MKSSDIQSAFAEIRRPDDVAMFGTNLLPRDRRVADEVFRAQQRDKISLHQVADDADIVYFMQPETFAYFLPRLMELCLSEPPRAENLYDKLVFMFLAERRAAPYMDGYHQVLDDLLTDGMKRTIRSFFDDYLARYPAVGPPPGPLWV